MRTIDLHTHTAKSDGSFSPAELVDYAIEKNLAAVAITDHDTIEGLDEAIAHGAALREKGVSDIEVIPGIEFSTKYENQDVHIVGLYIAYNSAVFLEPLDAFINSRTNRNNKMCENLQSADPCAPLLVRDVVASGENLWLAILVRAGEYAVLQCHRSVHLLCDFMSP